MSEDAKVKLHSILRLEVSQLSKPRVSDFGTTASTNFDIKDYNSSEKSIALPFSHTKA